MIIKPCSILPKGSTAKESLINPSVEDPYAAPGIIETCLRSSKSVAKCFVFLIDLETLIK